MTYRAQIGTDTSLDTAEGGNAVMIQSHNGSVFITGPFEGWMGYARLADYPIEDAQAADDLARSITADPAARLAGLNYDLGGWFQPL